MGKTNATTCRKVTIFARPDESRKEKHPFWKELPDAASCDSRIKKGSVAK